MYTIKQASARSGVGIPLLRAWERRYGVVRPTRTPAGYRLYDDEAIDRLRAMRRLVEGGWLPRDAAPRVRAADLETIRDLAGGPAPVDAPSGTAEGLVGRIVSAATRVDQAALEAALDEAFGATRFEAASQHVVLPALVEVGRAWERGELDVGAEHAASAAVLRRLGAAFQAAGTPIGAPAVVVGLPPGSQHELAALAFAITARRAGLDVIYLGPDVPVDSWLSTTRDVGAAAVVLGAVMPRDAGTVSAVFAALAETAPAVIRAVGGPHAAEVAGSDHLVLPPDLLEAATVLRRALPRGPRGRAA
jgi:methanogenic corrinoid protein MtbC1